MKKWLGISTLIWGVLLLLSLPMVMMSPMMFDAPDSTENQGIWMAFYCLISFPVVALLSIIFSWLFYRKNNKNTALYLSLLPLLNIIFFFLSLILLA